MTYQPKPVILTAEMKGTMIANNKNTVVLPRPLLKQVEGLARELKVSRNRVFAMSVEALQRRRNRKLLEQINAAVADGPDKTERELMRRMKPHYRKMLEGEW